MKRYRLPFCIHCDSWVFCWAGFCLHLVIPTHDPFPTLPPFSSALINLGFYTLPNWHLLNILWRYFCTATNLSSARCIVQLSCCCRELDFSGQPLHLLSSYFHEESHLTEVSNEQFPVLLLPCNCVDLTVLFHRSGCAPLLQFCIQGAWGSELCVHTHGGETPALQSHGLAAAGSPAYPKLSLPASGEMKRIKSSWANYSPWTWCLWFRVSESQPWAGYLSDSSILTAGAIVRTAREFAASEKSTGENYMLKIPLDLSLWKIPMVMWDWGQMTMNVKGMSSPATCQSYSICKSSSSENSWNSSSRKTTLPHNHWSYGP